MLGYFLLPISALPSVDFPTTSRSRPSCRGAAPDVMVSSVTTPLEQQFGQISGLTSMNSVSSFGVSTITLQFSLERNIDSASQDVQAKAINVATGVLPQNLPNPPVYNKVNPADTAILTLALTSDTLPIDEVDDKGDTLLAQKLSEVTGVGLVTIEGNQKKAVRVQIDPAATAAQGLSLEDVRNAIGNANVDQPKGSFDGAHQAYAINANDQLLAARDYRSIIVAYRNGAPIRLSNIGRVVDSVENTKLAGWYGDKPAILLDIQRQPGANIIQTVDRIKRLLPGLLSALPPSVHVPSPDRPHDHDPGLGGRRPVHPGPDRLPRRHGHLRFPRASFPRAAVIRAWPCRSPSSAHSGSWNWSASAWTIFLSWP